MRARPTLDVAYPAAPDEVLATFRARLREPGAPCAGHVGKRELSLVLCEARRGPFSPWLSVEAHPHAGGTRLRGHFGPHPHLWGLFVGLYALGVFAFLGGLMFGWAQSISNQAPTALWVSLVAMVWQALACGIDLVGRRVGAPQMAILRQFIADTLPGAAELADDEPPPHLQRQRQNPAG